MKYTVQQMIDRFNAGKSPTLMLFWGHTVQPGRITKACFSQWYPAHFTVDGREYICTEQYMMAEKARLFGDTTAHEAIMHSDQAKEIKALGRQVQGFTDALWNENKYRIVLEGNIAKFSQNEPLRAFLLGTDDAIIAEASPYDGIWGIRLAQTDPRAQDPRTWRGENLLGFALMETRDILRDASK